MNRRPSLVLISSLVVLLALVASAQQKQLITEKDLFKFNWIADPQMSPDGSRIAFVKVVVNQKSDGYETSLWTVASDGSMEPQQVLTGAHDTSPRWSPDGSKIAFLRAKEKDPKEGKLDPPELWVVAATGGEPTQLTHLVKGVHSPAWSPDGSRLAVTSEFFQEPDSEPKSEVGLSRRHDERSS